MPSGETRNDQAALASWTTVPTGNSTRHGRPFPGSRTTATSFVPAIQSASTIPSSRSRRAPPASGTLASVRAPNARSTFCGPKRTAMSFDGEIDSIRPACSDRSRASRPSAPAKKDVVRVSVPAGAVHEALAVRCEPRRRHGAVSERHSRVSRRQRVDGARAIVPTHTRLVSAVAATRPVKRAASVAGVRISTARRRWELQPQSMRALSRGRARFASARSFLLQGTARSLAPAGVRCPAAGSQPAMVAPRRWRRSVPSACSRRTVAVRSSSRRASHRTRRCRSACRSPARRFALAPCMAVSRGGPLRESRARIWWAHVHRLGSHRRGVSRDRNPATSRRLRVSITLLGLRSR